MQTGGGHLPYAGLAVGDLLLNVPESHYMTSQGPNKRKRASRYNVPNNERVILTIDGDHMVASLNVLSVTGGTLRTARRLDPGTLADFKMTTVAGPVAAVIEMLTVRGGTQAFRFVHLDGVNRHRLEDGLGKLKAQGLAHDQGGAIGTVIRFAKNLISGSNKR